jgi:hypothetical protein
MGIAERLGFGSQAQEVLRPVNLSAVMIDIFIGTDGLPFPDAVLDEPTQWMTNVEIEAERAAMPSSGALLEDLRSDPSVQVCLAVNSSVLLGVEFLWAKRYNTLVFWHLGGVVTQRSAKPFTPVRFR